MSQKVTDDLNKLQRMLFNLRMTHPDIEDIFTQGGCYRLFLVIKSVFPKANAYYDEKVGHVYTELHGRYFDITGKLYGNPEKLTPMKELVLDCEQWHLGFWEELFEAKKIKT